MNETNTKSCFLNKGLTQQGFSALFQSLDVPQFCGMELFELILL